MGKSSSIKKKVIWFYFTLLYSYFDAEELRMLLSIVRDEKLCAKKQYTKMISDIALPIEVPTAENRRTDGIRNQMNKYETFRVDFDTFRLLLTELTEWGRCHNVVLAEKLFRVR